VDPVVVVQVSARREVKVWVDPALARPALVLPVAMADRVFRLAADRVFRLAADLMAASDRGSGWVRPRAIWGPASGLRAVRLGSVHRGSILRVPTNSPATQLPMPTDKPVVEWEAGVGVDVVEADRLVANARNHLSLANNSRRTM
jgi:hypothetical protein